MGDLEMQKQKHDEQRRNIDNRCQGNAEEPCHGPSKEKLERDEAYGKMQKGDATEGTPLPVGGGPTDQLRPQTRSDHGLHLKGCGRVHRQRGFSG